MSDEELSDITGIEIEKTAVKTMFCGKVKLVIVTKGSKGATAYTQNAEVFAPSVKVEKPVDTTGAGDSFMGATLYQLIKNGCDFSAEELKKILVYANKTAGYVVGGQGAIQSMPTGEQIFGK